jgi:hypothetical protein
MRLHPETLAAVQQRVLRRLGAVLTSRKFYLGGGTALAIRLGHRRSVDLDWFTSERLFDPVRLAQELRDAGVPLVKNQVAPGTLYGSVSRVRVSLLEYRYAELQPRELWPSFGCELASLADLAAMKLSAIAQRGAKRDFVDLDALGQEGLTLSQMIAWYQQKFDIQDTVHLLYSLNYFEDADRERLPRLLRPRPWKTVKRTISQWVRQVAM